MRLRNSRSSVSNSDSDKRTGHTKDVSSSVGKVVPPPAKKARTPPVEEAVSPQVDESNLTIEGEEREEEIPLQSHTENLATDDATPPVSSIEEKTVSCSEVEHVPLEEMEVTNEDEIKDDIVGHDMENVEHDEAEDSDTGSDVFMPVGMPLRNSESSDIEDERDVPNEDDEDDDDDDDEDEDMYEIDDGLQVDEKQDEERENQKDDVIDAIEKQDEEKEDAGKGDEEKEEQFDDGSDNGAHVGEKQIEEVDNEKEVSVKKDNEQDKSDELCNKEPTIEELDVEKQIPEKIDDEKDDVGSLVSENQDVMPSDKQPDDGHVENKKTEDKPVVDDDDDDDDDDEVKKTDVMTPPAYETFPDSIDKIRECFVEVSKSDNCDNIINKKKTDNEFTEDTFDEGNIFSKTDIFYENHAMGSDSFNEKEKNSPKIDEVEDGKAEEHDISDDFLKGHQDVGENIDEDEFHDKNRSTDKHEVEEKDVKEDKEPVGNPPVFENTEQNIYLIDKKRSRSGKDIRRMVCECPFEPDDPLFIGCDEDCLNRLLMIECNKNCPTGEFCTNKAFQKGCIYNLEIIKAGKKGWGLKTNENITKGAFVIEYCGEVVDYTDFHLRTQRYAKEGIGHFYFMTLKTNEIIDATKKGSISRFINHSCDPNCVTQKWTANGFLRVGFFALRHIRAGEELSFDYQFQRYGEKPQECFCGSGKCRGVIGTEQIATVPSYVEKYLSCSSTKKKGKGSKESKKPLKDFYESALAEDLKELLGDKWILTEPTQTLELVRLMVKTETSHERRELLKIMQASADTNALKSFVRYKGLDLLWSWMIDASSENRNKYRYEILKTLKHIPIRNKNELDDSKLISIVSKWAVPAVDSTSENASDEETTQSPSSDTDDRKDGNSTSNDESVKEEEADPDKKKSSNTESMEEGEILDDDEVGSKKSKRKNKLKKSELKKRQKESMRKRDVSALAQQLLDEWKLLKEVFRIPKKARPVDDRPTDGSDGSPLQDEKRLKDKANAISPLQATESWQNNNYNNKQTPPDSTYSSPVTKQKQMRMHKGVASFINRVGEENELTSSSEEQSSSNFDDINDNFHPRNRKGLKRDWMDNHPNKMSRSCNMDQSDYSEQSGTVDSTSNWSGDSSYENPNQRKGHEGGGGGGRRMKRGKDRRRSYEDDRRNKWNEYNHDDMMESDNDNRNRGWDDNKNNKMNRNRNWNNRGGGRQNNRDMGPIRGGNYDGPPDDYLSWRNRNNDYWNPQPPPPKPQPPLPQPPQPPQFNELSSNIPSLMDQEFDQGCPTIPPNQQQQPHHQQQQPQQQPQQQSQQQPQQAPHQQPPRQQQPHQQPHQQPSLQQPHQQQQQQQQQPPLQRPLYPTNPNSSNLPPTCPPAIMPPQMPNMICPPPYLLPPPPLPPQPLNPAALNPHITPLLPNQVHKNSPIVSPMSSQPYNPVSVPLPTDMNQTFTANSTAPYHPTASTQQPEVNQVNAITVVNQLHQLLTGDRHQTPDFNRNSTNTSPVQSSSSSPQRTKPLPALPPHWKTATDADGRVYYYHSITRETSWDPPPQSEEGESQPSSPISKRNRKNSSDGVRSPSNHSPRIAAADTTHHHGPRTPPVQQSSSKVMSSAELQKIRDTFKAKMSSVVVNCLNSYQKVDCKQGRIKNVDDFKFLARKLTHGLIMKEIQRIKNEELLICNDSVKVKVKEYIRNYMKKFGVCYVRS